MKEFMYCFQISKLIVFEVEYYTLGGNKRHEKSIDNL